MSTSRPPRRVALIVLVVVAAAACLALGWWQWSRFESSSGTAQNLGYALQWPAFAFFCVYAYRRFVRLEAGDDPEQTDDAPLEIPDDLIPRRATAAPDEDDPDGALRSRYNDYLADLAGDRTPDGRADTHHPIPHQEHP